MKLVKKCLIEFNNQRTNKITKKEVDDDEKLRFTLLDMQKFAKKYHKQKLTLTDVVNCVCKIPEPRMIVSENGIHYYCNNCSKTWRQK